MPRFGSKIRVRIRWWNLSWIRQPISPLIYPTQFDFCPTQLFGIVEQFFGIVVPLNEILAPCISAMGCWQ
jgi:hypothetical protein